MKTSVILLAGSVLLFAVGCSEQKPEKYSKVRGKREEDLLKNAFAYLDDAKRSGFKAVFSHWGRSYKALSSRGVKKLFKKLDLLLKSGFLNSDTTSSRYKSFTTVVHCCYFYSSDYG